MDPHLFVENYKIQRSKKKTKALGWTLEAYDSIGRLWHPTLGWPQLTHSSCWTQSPASQGQPYIVDIIMCHLETVKTYLVLKPISTAAQYCLLLVVCNVCNKHLEHLKPYHIPETWVESKATKTPRWNGIFEITYLIQLHTITKFIPKTSKLQNLHVHPLDPIRPTSHLPRVFLGAKKPEGLGWSPRTCHVWVRPMPQSMQKTDAYVLWIPQW